MEEQEQVVEDEGEEVANENNQSERPLKEGVSGE